MKVALNANDPKLKFYENNPLMICDKIKPEVSIQNMPQFLEMNKDFPNTPISDEEYSNPIPPQLATENKINV